MEPTSWGVLTGVIIGISLLLWQYFRQFTIELWKKIVSIGSVIAFFILVFTLPRLFLFINSIPLIFYVDQKYFLPLFQTSGIVFSIWIGIYNIRRAVRLEKLRSLSDMTKSNRDILTFYISNQEKLSRVFANTLIIDLDIEPVSIQEKIYINILILHFNVIFNSLENNVSSEIEKLEIDIGGFLILPLPNAVWNQAKIYQNGNFVKFVDNCIKNQNT